MSDDVLVRVEGVSKKFCRSLKRSLFYGLQDIGTEILGNNGKHDELRKGEFWAVHDVSFDLRRGECLGLIGRNGAGKTTLLKMLNGIIKPDVGTITICGRVGALIALGAGFNPILTGRENIYVNGSVLGLQKKEIETKIEEIIDFAEIREFIDSPVQSYSSGMQVRLGFAVATALEPDVLLLDEVLAVGDAKFRNKCYSRIASIKKNTATIFVSHFEEHVSRICSSALLLNNGRQETLGTPSDVLEHYRGINETTISLSSSSFDLLGSNSQPLAAGSFISTKYPVKEAKLYIDKNLYYAEPWDINIEIENLAHISKYQLRIVIKSIAGEICAEQIFSTSTDEYPIPIGKTMVNIHINQLPLKSGKYTISVMVIDQNGEFLVWLNEVDIVQVHGSFVGANSYCQIPAQIQFK